MTAEKCDQILHFVQDRPDPEEREATKDEKEQFAASEGRSPYEKLRGAKRRVNLLGVFLERRKA